MPERKPPPERDMRANISLSVQDILDRIEMEQIRESRKRKKLEDRVAALESLLRGRLNK